MSLIDVIRHPVEQTVGGGGIGGLPGFLPGQSYSLSAEQIVDNPVPCFRLDFCGGLHGLHPGQSSTSFGRADLRFPAATAEQNIDFPAPRGGRVPHPASSSSDLPETANQWFFSHFSRSPRCRNWARTSAHGLRELSWWSCPLAPALMAARASWGTTCVRLLLHGPRGRRGTGECGFSGVHLLPDDHGSLGEAGTMPLSCVSLWMLLEEFPLLCARVVRTWNLVTDTGVWVLLLSTEN